MSRRFGITIRTALVACLVTLFAMWSPAAAHDDIVGSTPETRSTIADPISDVEIDFGETIGDNVKMVLTYDLVTSDGAVEDLGGTTVKTGDTTARLDFDRIDREGRYFVNYLAPVPADGHVIAGSISFTWGDPPSGSGFPVVPFIALAAVILAVGAWFSYRRMLVGDDVEAPSVVEASSVVDGPDPA